MNREASTHRRHFLKQASMLVAATHAGALLPSASGDTPSATNQVKPLPAPRGSAPIVDTSSGKVRGMLQDGINVFKGIPYGASTAGTNRFMPPKKPMPWSGVRDATAFGHSAPQPQLAGPYDYLQIIDFVNVGRNQAEDCLVLNAWTPAVNDNGKRPVLVSFHGGGFSLGSGSIILYDGQPLAKFGDVVVVTLNHRLGCLGYLSMAEVGAPPEFAHAGAAGMLDCVLALEWVRDHIANFGGDPGNVTIFGQSGGGAKVSHLLNMPAVRGLFHKAAIQSGSRLRAVTREAAAGATEQLLAQIGLTRKRVTELQQVPVEMLIAAQATLDTPTSDIEFAPAIDDSVIPRHPFDPDAPALSADVSVIVSTTLDDASYWSTDFDLDEAGLTKEVEKMSPGKAGAIIAAYRRAFRSANPFLLLGKMATDREPRRNAYTLADRKAALHRGSVYMYMLEFPSPAYGGRFGAVHATDVPLVFHNTAHLITGTGPDSKRMADQMAGAWVAFAKSGNPNHAGIPEWPAYTPDTRQTMIFNSTSRVENDPWGELRSMWSKG